MVSHDTRDPEAGKAELSPSPGDGQTPRPTQSDRPRGADRRHGDRKAFLLSVAGSALGRLLADAVRAVAKRISEAVDLIP
ncbi:hypothetical protein DFR70_106246 [Nocardia tenerifensis]|uniref:Uncharacterized protein n=1 Tax=Nocardia tenerifensis TaxID=228006 RepID=A0A318K073_9NOCA|nr:hypothetical protein DFR70_106246 [Nocardia tenerifensis]